MFEHLLVSVDRVCCQFYWSIPTIHWAHVGIGRDARERVRVASGVRPFRAIDSPIVDSQRSMVHELKPLARVLFVPSTRWLVCFVRGGKERLKLVFFCFEIEWNILKPKRLNMHNRLDFATLIMQNNEMNQSANKIGHFLGDEFSKIADFCRKVEWI